MYAAHATGAAISFGVAALFRFNSLPFTSCLTAANRVLQYPKSTANFQLHFSRGYHTNRNDQLTGYTDSDWASDCADGKSPEARVLLLSNVGVSCQSRDPEIINMSTLEAEYIACSEGSHGAK
jgi:hypothetical protein